MSRILVIGDHVTTERWLAQTPVPAYVCERASGSVDAIQRLRDRAFEVVITSPDTPIAEDLALLEEIRQVRPGVKAIVLAPAATPLDVIAALKASVFACFAAPFDPSAITEAVVAATEAVDWHDGIQVLTARPEWIALRVTCSLLNAERLVQFMAALRSDVPETDRDNLLFAFREMLLNAMEHGAGFDPEKVVEVAAVRTRRAIVYYFRDPGRGFQTTSLAHAAIANAPFDPFAHLDHRAEMGLRAGGFGILLVRQLVDEVIYSEVGNECC